jgi:hypothetical protein
MPIKGYLKKYLLYHYGPEPITASRNSTLGIVLYSILERIELNWQPTHWLPPDDEIKFSVSENYIKRSGFVISPYNYSLFNNYVDSQFRDLLLARIDDKLTEMNEPPIGFYKREIKSFFNKYGIEEYDFAMDRMVKHIYRERQRIKKIKEEKTGTSCPSRIKNFGGFSQRK